MNSYVTIMNQVIDFIEENICEPLTLQDIAKRFYLSEFHFCRMFKIVTGNNLRQYILSRKLTLALERMLYTKDTVTQTAMEYGFEYPEVFSRAFKKQFGISPSQCKRTDISYGKVLKASVVERDITNIKGTLAIKDSVVYLNNSKLYGISKEVNENHPDFEQVLNTTGGNYVRSYGACFEEKQLYSVVNCHEDDSGEYTVFFGAKIIDTEQRGRLAIREIPEGWYAAFQYYGDMLEIRSTFVEDLYRWIMIKEISLCQNGIGMINIYNTDDIKDVKILIPIVKWE